MALQPGGAGANVIVVYRHRVLINVNTKHVQYISINLNLGILDDCILYNLYFYIYLFIYLFFHSLSLGREFIHIFSLATCYWLAVLDVH